MAEEVRITDYGVSAARDGGCGGGGEDDERVSEWEDGLPNVDDLTPLSQSLISSEMLYAFNISPEPYRSMIDVNRASHSTLSNLRGEIEQQSFTRFDTSKSFGGDKGDEMLVEGEETADLTPGGSGGRKLQRIGSGGGVDGGGAVEETESDLQADDPSSRVSKRPRLVWTPQLHKRFIEVVAHLGVKNAVPKTIMQLMNVEGLTRENVASHLQKYRLYLKRMQSLPTQGSSSSDAAGGNGYHPPPAVVPATYPPQMVHHTPYNAAVQQQRHWGGSKLDAVAAYHHGMTPNNK